jgi:Ankyrin repeats (3 copies)/Ankyrin repeats (many copies)
MVGLRRATLQADDRISLDGMNIGPYRGWAAGAAIFMALAGAVAAHESEQVTLPAGREFADLGPHLSRIVYRSVVDAAKASNAAIRTAIESGQPQGEIERLQSVETVSNEVWVQLFAALPTLELLDAGLLHADVRSQYPGLVTMHRPVESIYDDPLLVIDLTKPVRTFFRAGTINVGGTMFGTDKIIHFINIGRIYHGKYLTRRARGMDEAAASVSAIESTARNPLLSEDGVLGWFTTGIRSNGDLAADYAGLKFYRNVTEQVRVGPRTLPPMLVREGAYWRVELAPDTDIFTAFVTPHWNEALNPNKYVKYVRNRVRIVMRQRCEDVLDWYPGDTGQPMTRAEFEAVERELSTYFGEPYGFLDDGASRVSVATVCFDRPQGGARPESVAASPATTGADTLARGKLWWAARAGRADEVRRLVAAGENPNVADVDGETAVHAAARSGNAAVVSALLESGGDPNRPGLYGVTPLQLAVVGGRVEVVAMLLQGGARPNAPDLFGKTALHDAAARGSVQLAELLLAHGADPSATDDAGTSPLHIAAASGQDRLAAVLVARGASLRTRNIAGVTPSDAAKRAGHSELAGALMPPTQVGPMAPSAAAQPATAAGESQRQ